MKILKRTLAVFCWECGKRFRGSHKVKIKPFKRFEVPYVCYTHKQCAEDAGYTILEVFPKKARK